MAAQKCRICHGQNRNSNGRSGIFSKLYNGNWCICTHCMGSGEEPVEENELHPGTAIFYDSLDPGIPHF